jgi:hypothetical protein
MKRIRTSALAIALAITTPVLTVAWLPQDADAATAKHRPERAKARAHCDEQAKQRNLVTRSVLRRNFLRDCMRGQGYTGPP